MEDGVSLPKSNDTGLPGGWHWTIKSKQWFISQGKVSYANGFVARNRANINNEMFNHHTKTLFPLPENKDFSNPTD